MACLQLQFTRSGSCPVLGVRPGLRRRRWSSRLAGGGVLRVRCCLGEGGAASDGEEPPESLFKKELKRRGMSPTPMLEDSASSREPLPRLPEGMEMGEELSGGGGGEGLVRRNGVASADYEEGPANQRERSMSLNSEGLEGLIPRAKLLVTIGGSFFLGFWPLMLVTIGFFSALYIYSGSSFVHDASKMHTSPPPYVNPYALLQDERISQRTPRVD